MRNLLLLIPIFLFLIGCAQKDNISNTDERSKPKFETVNIVYVTSQNSSYDGGGVSVGGFGGSHGSGVGVGIDLGRVFGSRSSDILINYEQNGKFYEISQKGKICEFKKGNAVLVNKQKIEPNSFCE